MLLELTNNKYQATNLIWWKIVHVFFPKTATMFSYMTDGKLVIILDLQAQPVLAKLLAAKDFGFYTFRRSGSSLAFSVSIPVQDIKAQGSDSVYNYLNPACYPAALTKTITIILGTTH